jgi:hypothetical protein
MAMGEKHCAGCGRTFRPCSHVPEQRYCSSADCQRARRRCWQRSKRQSDPDYRDNQAQAQRRWAREHREYWRGYRQGHPDYSQRNRDAARQRQRERRRHAAKFAKMDASAPISPVSSGLYRLVPASAGGFAKMDACTVKLTVISNGYELSGGLPRGLQRDDLIGPRGPPC